DFEDPFADMSFLGGEVDRIGVVNLRKALNQAASDDKIKGVVLYAPSLMGGFALGQEARKALEDFKSSGKFIWAYSEILTEGGYYISSIADKIYLNPEGIIEWNGLSAEVTFFKGTFDKLDIKPQIFRVGEYKSAVEPFMTDKMSDASREQMRSLINSVYGSIVNEIAASSDLTPEQLMELSDNMTVQLPQDAVDHGLVTELMYKDEFNELVAKEIGLEEANDINWATYSQYNSSFSGYKKSKNKIAVIIAEGEIMMGNKQQGLITPAQFVKELKRAREDKNVKAVVFRVNSPGGDPLASDLIWREVVKTSKVKPIIASMSNYAASGGYYISMAADSIVAEPTTITGSIGIYGIVFNIGDFMANKLGITTDRESTGNFSNIFTTSRALTDAEKTIIQNMVNSGYESFTTKAAEGRNMQLEDLLKVASGRVWTGIQAKEIGLVDEIGGLEDAINIAAAKAGIEDDYKVRYYPMQKTALEELMDKLSGTTNAKILQNKLGDFYPYVDLLDKVERMKGVQARMPFEVEIQ
ncbi:MAG: signal peptide peptidase SppA, partial [Bacteroidota bacterium]